jgi:hypothetical protein
MQYTSNAGWKRTIEKVDLDFTVTSQGTYATKDFLQNLNQEYFNLLPSIHPVIQERIDGILASVKLSGDTDYNDINGPELPGDNEPDFSGLANRIHEINQGEPNAAHVAVSEAISDPVYSAPEKIREMRIAADLWTKLAHRIEEHNVALLEIRSIRDEMRKLSVFDFLHMDYETVETNPDNPQIGMLLLPGTRPIFKN